MAVRGFILRTAALLLLVAGTSGASATDPPGKDATVPVPEPGVLYVRYGTPGGVKIHSVTRPPVPESTGDSLGAGALRAGLHRLLVEELGLLSAEGAVAGRTSPVRDPAARSGPPAAGIVVLPGAPPPAKGRTSFVGVLPGPDLAGMTTEEAAIELETTGVLRTTQIHFAYDRSDILPASEPALRTLGEVLKNNPDWAIRVEGHADARGDECYNLRLSQRRAAAVVAWLVEKQGVGKERLTSIGFGESLPLVDGTTEEAYAANRRVEFRLAE